MVDPHITEIEGASRFHFVGIGGSGMSGIAFLCMERGLLVTGSDVDLSPVTERLVARGAKIARGHCAVNIEGADVLVRSTAVGDDNEEIRAAFELGIPVLHRSQLLAWLMRSKCAVTVAGSHGKTSSTALLGTIMQAAGLEPTVVVGGDCLNFRGNVLLGPGRHIVVEADESDGSFLNLPGSAVLVTNIDDDHLEYYKTMENLIGRFLVFINRIGSDGIAALCCDDQRLRRILARVKVPYVTYGFSPLADYRLENVEINGFESVFDIRLPGGKKMGPFRLCTPGEHQALNAAGCIALAHRLGVPTEALLSGTALYRGVERRFQKIGNCGGITVIDDYAHHPTEIKAVLAATRRALPDCEIVVVFQPHRSSRTALQAEKLGLAFKDADKVLLLPVYHPAGEAELEGVSSQLVYSALKDGHPCALLVECGELSEAVPIVGSQVGDRACLLTLGAGSVTRLGPMLLDYWNR